MPPEAGGEGEGGGSNSSAGVGEVLGAEVLTMSRIMCTLDLESNSDMGLQSFSAQGPSLYCSMCVNSNFLCDTTALNGGL